MLCQKIKLELMNSSSNEKAVLKSFWCGVVKHKDMTAQKVDFSCYPINSLSFHFHKHFFFSSRHQSEFKNDENFGVKKPSSLLWLSSLSLLLPINIVKHSSAFYITCCAFINLKIGGRMCQTLLQTFKSDFLSR